MPILTKQTENRFSFKGQRVLSAYAEPGARTLWLGLQEIAIFVKGARYARTLSETEIRV